MLYDPEKITFFAKTDARGKNVPFGIKAKDRTRHVYVIGKTGMGKSTLLENMAVQDIQNGEGLAFIDPHGQTAETLLDYIPEERIKDVLYFAPHDTDFPVSFNVMEDVGPDKRHLVVSGLMSVFKKIFVDQWSARMEYILQNTILALLEYPDSTLLGVNRMLSDKIYRKKVIDNITDPSVKSFWVDEFLKYNERYMQEAGDAIKNKIGQFTANPVIRNIIGQPKSSFDMRQIMDEKKILIMNLSKGLIGETNANLLGSMLTTRIYLAAMSRADLSQAQMKDMANFYFYVDEFQSFANATFANILSEARKYKLNLTIAHQYIEQMEEDVKNAVFGNVGTIVSFRTGPFDAEVLETIFSPKFYAVDICNLGFAQVYLTLMIDGIGSQPFSAVTLPPIEHHGTSYKDMILDSSRSQFGHRRADVEEQIMLWHASDTVPNNKQTDKNDKPVERRVNRDSPPVKKEWPRRETESRTPDRSRSEEKPRERSPRRDSDSGSSPRPRTEEKPKDVQPRKENKTNEKSLEELRSILKNISGNNDRDTKNTPQNSHSRNAKPSPKPPIESKPEENIKDKKADLQSALKNVLQSDNKPDPKPTKSESVEKKDSNDLNPQEIERMLQVGKDEQQPYKD